MINKVSQTQVFITLFGLTAVLFAGLTRAVIQFALLTTNVKFAGSDTPAPAERSVEPDFVKLLLVFEANHGQYDKSVKFLSRGEGYALLLPENDAVVKLRRN